MSERCGVGERLTGLTELTGLAAVEVEKEFMSVDRRGVGGH